MLKYQFSDNLLRTDRYLFKPLKPLPEDYGLLDRLCGDLRKVVDEKSRVVNQLISCLKEFYPKALELFSLNSQIFIDFLKTFPDPDTLHACTKKTFLAFLKKHRYPYPGKAEELWKTIQSPALQPDRIAARAGRLRLVMLLDQLENLKEHITHYEQEIQNILDNFPESNLIKSLPGVGERLAPELVAPLVQITKTATTDSRLPKKLQNSPAVYPLSDRVGNGKRCLSVTPA